jgi:polyisoprenoid-binding protein YceI
MKPKLIYLLLLFSFEILPQKLVIDHSKVNLVKFTADATLGDFEGTTSSIEGFIQFNGMILSPGRELDFKVRLDSIDTGIGLRNTHMREDYLETEKYEEGVFTGKIADVDTVSHSEFIIKAEGTFKIHGVKKNKVIEVKLYNFGELYKSAGEFILKLSEFKIKQPSFLFNTVDDNIKIHLSLYFKKV